MKFYNYFIKGRLHGKFRVNCMIIVENGSAVGIFSKYQPFDMLTHLHVENKYLQLKEVNFQFFLPLLLKG